LVLSKATDGFRKPRLNMHWTPRLANILRANDCAATPLPAEKSHRAGFPYAAQTLKGLGEDRFMIDLVKIENSNIVPIPAAIRPHWSAGPSIAAVLRSSRVAAVKGRRPICFRLNAELGAARAS
jgi:hypothetical protein